MCISDMSDGRDGSFEWWKCGGCDSLTRAGGNDGSLEGGRVRTSIRNACPVVGTGILNVGGVLPSIQFPVPMVVTGLLNVGRVRPSIRFPVPVVLTGLLNVAECGLRSAFPFRWY